MIQKFFLIGSILYCEETHSGGAYNMEKTKKIDVFNSTPRKIKCITNEMDYLGDGTRRFYMEDDELLQRIKELQKQNE